MKAKILTLKAIQRQFEWVFWQRHKRNCRVKEACHRCGKLGHIRPKCCVDLKEAEANVVQKSDKLKQIKCEQCLSTEAINQPINFHANVSIDCNKD